MSVVLVVVLAGSYVALLVSFGWLGALAIAAHLGVMLAAMRK